MYCPNCGARNNKKQNFCRYCGLHLEAIEKSFAGQIVFGDDTTRLKHLRNAKRMTDYAQSFSVILLLAGIIFLFVSDPGFGKVLITAGLLAYFLAQAVREFNGYLQRKTPRRNVLESSEAAGGRQTREADTGMLIEDRPFTPVPGVTEHSTELLIEGRSRTK